MTKPGASPRHATALLIAGVLAAACAGPSPRTSGSTDESRPNPDAGGAARTVTMAFRYEKNDLSTKTLSQAGQEYRPLFNAGLVLVDGKKMLQPQLAAEIPRLTRKAGESFPMGGWRRSGS